MRVQLRVYEAVRAFSFFLSARRQKSEREDFFKRGDLFLAATSSPLLSFRLSVGAKLLISSLF